MIFPIPTELNFPLFISIVISGKYSLTKLQIFAALVEGIKPNKSDINNKRFN